MSRSFWRLPLRAVVDELGHLQHAQLSHITASDRGAQFVCRYRADYCAVDMEE